jgi:hypothetical protein
LAAWAKGSPLSMAPPVRTVVVLRKSRRELLFMIFALICYNFTLFNGFKALSACSGVGFRLKINSRTSSNLLWPFEKMRPDRPCFAGVLP